MRPNDRVAIIVGAPSLGKASMAAKAQKCFASITRTARRFAVGTSGTSIEML
jgi:hypothetical protein